MNNFTISFSYLKHHAQNSILNILMMAVGIMLITILLLLGHQMQNKLLSDAKNIDGVVGAKGSSLQIALSSVWHVDIPTGNIAYLDFVKLSKNRLVKAAVPIALGDNYHGYRLVGTEHVFFDLYQAKLAEGQIWQDEMQVVIGNIAAKQNGFKVGDEFYSTHGLNLSGHVHKNKKFKIVGILTRTNTVLDRLMITSLESIWDLHEHHEEGDHKHEDEHHDHHSHDEKHDDDDRVEEHHDKAVTAVLLQFRNKVSVLNFANIINQNTNLQFAAPSFEIVKLTELIGVGSSGAKIFGGLLIMLSLASLLIALLNSVNQRKYDLAIFRSLGASRKRIFSLVLLEAFMIAFIGSILGIVFGHLIVEVISQISLKAFEIGLSGFVFVSTIYIFWIGFMILALLIALIPAMKAYKTDIRNILIHE